MEKCSRGFALYEVIVTLSIMVLLSTLALSYGASNRAQTRILRDEAAIVSYLGRARALAVKGYTAGETICAYGVHFDAEAKTITLFEDKASPCSAADYVRGAGDGDVETYALNPQVSVTAPSDITFVPPEVVVRVRPSGLWPAIVHLATGNETTNIEIYESGQITTP